MADRLEHLETRLDEAVVGVEQLLGSYDLRQSHVEAVKNGTVVDLEAHAYVAGIRRAIEQQGQDFSEVRRQRGIDNARSNEH